MSELISELNVWHWWIAALILIILEIFSPAAFFMWLGAAAAITGIIALLFPDLHWGVQLVIFSILSIITVWVGRSWFKSHPIDTDQPLLNQSSKEFIGKVFVVEKAIANGTGRIKVGDSSWKAVGPDAEIGDKVKVISADAAVLTVEKIS